MQADLKSLFGSFAGFVVFFSIMMGIGISRNWNVGENGFDYYVVYDDARFWPEPNGSLANANWYYWKLPPTDATLLSRLFVWVLYLGHQISIWVIMYKAQVSSPKYSSDMKRFNWISLGVNAFFHVAHLIQSHLTYDALAQDVQVSSSQGSVILLLIGVLILEYKERGLLLGWPVNRKSKWRLPSKPIELMRKYHGYMFAWGAIYTFWYHPMESTVGHFFGFMHTAIIMLQGSLMYTKAHLNKYWRFLVEFWVTIHGLLVAIQSKRPEGDLRKGTGLWPMFFFGFLWMAVFTQIHGLPILKGAAIWKRLIPVLLYFVLVFGLYGFYIPNMDGSPPPSWPRLQEIVRIPVIEYLFVLYLVFTLSAMDKAGRICFRSDKKLGTVFVALIFALCYGANVAFSIILEHVTLDLDNITLMIMFVAFFAICSSIAMIALRQSIRPPKYKNKRVVVAGDIAKEAGESTVIQ